LNHQWGSKDQANNSANFGAIKINQGSGKANRAANNTALYNNTTPGVWKSSGSQGAPVKAIVGQFGANAREMHSGNTSGEGAKVKSPGWNIRKQGLGGIKSVTASGGSSFANGETVTVSGGVSNGILALTSNSTGGLAAASPSGPSGGLFANTSGITFAFNRQQHMGSVTVTGGLGYANTDTIVASNGIQNATASISTNSTGGFVNGGITMITAGLWGNTVTNAQVSFTVLATGGAPSAGSGATLSANLVTSSGGTVTTPVLGGRAGRVHYECLVTLGLSNGASSLLPTS
jgi:hypothetical protein